MPSERGRSPSSENFIIGAGVTGLAAGAVCGVPVLEQSDGPGGICRSYYMAPYSAERSDHLPADGDAYRFEVGGGHWLFGTDPALRAEIQRLVPVRTYLRRAEVRIGSLNKTFPYPLQNHVAEVDPALARRIAAEPAFDFAEERAFDGDGIGEGDTLDHWLQRSFGPTLCETFFLPFNDRYTAGLSHVIAPQDTYKSPVPTGAKPSAGYNTEFCYPEGGLDRLVAAMAEQCQVQYNSKIREIVPSERLLIFQDGTQRSYQNVVSTVPLNQALQLAGITVEDPPDPHTSVLVLNIGAERGPACPDAHWQYEPDSNAGFHRIGFYSNVDSSFLPRCFQSGEAVSLYVERAYPAGGKPDEAARDAYIASVVEELHGRGYIGDVHVVDPSWVEVAYTWRYAGSNWQQQAIKALGEAGMRQAGRYGTWHFQGIAESMRDGQGWGKLIAAGG